MDRRVFLRETLMGAGVIACGAGGLWLRCSHLRGSFVKDLMDGARPVLDRHALEEQEKLPGQMRDEIRPYFDSMCLNVPEFLAEINTPEFRDKLSKMQTPERRHRELLSVYYRRVPAGAEVAEHIRSAALKMGTELDRHWADCCKEIAAKWKTRLQTANGPPFNADEFSARVTPLVQKQVEQAVHQARRVTEEPGWRQAVRSLGTEALLAGPDVTIVVAGKPIQLPEFLVNASRHVFGVVLDYLGDPQWDCQATITKRLASLGNQTAAEFDKEIRRRLNDLHAWREQAVRLAAEQHAAERIGFFGEHG